MTPERYQKILSVLNRRQSDLTVITDDVHKGQNLSAIVRTCDAIGIHEVHAVYSGGDYEHHTGTALGSQKWVQTNIYDTVVEPIQSLQASGHQVLAAHFTDRAVDFRSIDYTRPTAILFGAEKHGVSDQARLQVDGEIIIPMLGMVRSYNVSVACAIILSEIQRQRGAAGMYEKTNLPEEVYRKTLFEWCQPILTGYCNAKGIPYPELNDEGEVADPSVLERG